MAQEKPRVMIDNEAALRYLQSFREDYARRNVGSRNLRIFGEDIVIMPDVFPTDSPLSYSTESILRSVSSDVAAGELDRKDIGMICDVGTGSGVFLVVLSTYFHNARLVGLEIDPIAVRNAAYNTTHHGLGNCSIYLSDLFSATSESFDLIVTSLPFVCDLRYGSEVDAFTLERFWSEVDARVRPGGHLYINWASWADFKLFESLARQTTLRLLRCDEYSKVAGGFSWRTYIFKRI